MVRARFWADRRRSFLGPRSESPEHRSFAGEAADAPHGGQRARPSEEHRRPRGAQALGNGDGSLWPGERPDQRSDSAAPHGPVREFHAHRGGTVDQPVGFGRTQDLRQHHICLPNRSRGETGGVHLCHERLYVGRANRIQGEPAETPEDVDTEQALVLGPGGLPQVDFR
jgi:hypothetical protein